MAGSLAVAVIATGATAAQAVHWPVFGGDNGRSGYQPVDEGTVPLTATYSKTAASEQFVKTSIVTSTGSPTTQRLAFGTREGFVHFQILGTGTPVGPEEGTDILEANEAEAARDVFGTRGTAPGGNGASVSFADASVATGLGQLFAVHNDDDDAAGAADIEIAQFDETTGLRVRNDVDVAGTDGFTVDSSLNITGPAATDGSRVLFFVARRDADPTDARLFRVAVTGNATTSAATVVGGTATDTGDIDATPLASPTIAFFDVAGLPTAHVVVGTATGVRSFRTTDLVAGPSFTGPAGQVFQTPSVPVQPSGMSPNPAGPVTTAPFLYVAATAGTDTAVYKLRPSAGALVPAVTARTIAGSGLPAPALAVEQESEPTLVEGKIIVTTANNLYLLNTGDLSAGGQLSATGLTAGGTGFAQTTAAASGDFGYVNRDNGDQVVFRISDGQQVTAAQFTEQAGNPDLPGTGVGQPSISRGFIQFSTGSGIFVYRNVDTTAPTVTITDPASDTTTATATVTLSANVADARGITRVDFLIDGRVVGSATTPSSGSPFAGTGAVYSVTVNTSSLVNGSRTITAVAVDTSGLSTTSAARRITVTTGQAAPTPTPTPAATATVSPTPTAVPTACGGPEGLRLELATINAGSSARVVATATPNSIVQLLAYTRPSTTYRVVRTTVIGTSGTNTFAVVPGSNTRLKLRQQGCPDSPSVVLNVRTTLGLGAARTGPGTYRFSGRTLPSRPAGLIVSLYRITPDGRQVLTAQTRASANGTYVINRRFTGTGRFGFVLHTGRDLQNAPGASAVRSVLIN